GCSQRELPVRQPKPSCQLTAYPLCVFSGQHGRRPTTDLRLYGSHGGTRSVACECSRIPKTEVVVGHSIHIRKLRPVSFGEKNRERARPFRHPAHRHAAQKASTRSSERVSRPRVLLDEGLPLLFVERFEPVAV